MPDERCKKCDKFTKEQMIRQGCTEPRALRIGSCKCNEVQPAVPQQPAQPAGDGR